LGPAASSARARSGRTIGRTCRRSARRPGAERERPPAQLQVGGSPATATQAGLGAPDERRGTTPATGRAGHDTEHLADEPRRRPNAGRSCRGRTTRTSSRAARVGRPRTSRRTRTWRARQRAVAERKRQRIDLRQLDVQPLGRCPSRASRAARHSRCRPKCAAGRAAAMQRCPSRSRRRSTCQPACRWRRRRGARDGVDGLAITGSRRSTRPDAGGQ
jgi:hypothetical protein